MHKDPQMNKLGSLELLSIKLSDLSYKFIGPYNPSFGNTATTAAPKRVVEGA